MKCKKIKLLSIIKSLVFVIVFLVSGCNQETKKVRPNFVFIIGDDISVEDFGCYGHPTIRTPMIDSLASNGLRFTEAYLTTSQCSPTRSSLITGRYPHNTGSPELHMALPEGQPLFPQKLKESGYYCAQAGKWHLGEFAKIAFNKVWEMDGGGPGGEERWIECLQDRPKDKPFFLWLASTDAHRPWKPDRNLEKHLPKDVIVPPYLIDTPSGRIDMAGYYDEIQRLDYFVGEVIDELKQQGEFANTCIIFMADNGRPFPRCKTRLYDSGIKTPLIIHWPEGLKYKNKVTQSLVSAIDIAPTILDLAGLKSGEQIQGTSMVPILKNLNKEIREYAFAEHNWHAQIAHERMVRWKDYVYIRNAHPQLPQVCTLEDQCPAKELREFYAAGKTTAAQADPIISPRPREEFYVLTNDPYQIVNQVENPNYIDELNHLRKVLDEWQDRTGDTTPSLEKATPDRHNRKTGERYYQESRPPTGELPGESKGATMINDPGPR